MLKAISDHSQGVYYFVEHKDQIPEAFGDCIGGLLSVVGQNVSLTVEGISGASVTQVRTYRSIPYPRLSLVSSQKNQQKARTP